MNTDSNLASLSIISELEFYVANAHTQFLSLKNDDPTFFEFALFCSLYDALEVSNSIKLLLPHEHHKQCMQLTRPLTEMVIDCAWISLKNSHSEYLRRKITRSFDKLYKNTSRSVPGFQQAMNSVQDPIDTQKIIDKALNETSQFKSMPRITLYDKLSDVNDYITCKHPSFEDSACNLTHCYKLFVEPSNLAIHTTFADPNELDRYTAQGVLATFGFAILMLSVCKNIHANNCPIDDWGLLTDIMTRIEVQK